MMEHMISRLGQTGAKGGALAMLAALTAFTVSGDSLALLIFPILVSVVQLFCLIEGPWTAPMLQCLPVRVTTKRRLPQWRCTQ
jgi:hypothetical protein